MKEYKTKKDEVDNALMTLRNYKTISISKIQRYCFVGFIKARELFNEMIKRKLVVFNKEDNHYYLLKEGCLKYKISKNSNQYS